MGSQEEVGVKEGEVTKMRKMRENVEMDGFFEAEWFLSLLGWIILSRMIISLSLTSKAPHHRSPFFSLSSSSSSSDF